MPNMFERGLTMLNSKLKEHAGQAVTYSRGESSVSDLQAVQGKSDHPLTERHSASVVTRTVEHFDFDAAELILDSAAITPAIGDRVTTAAGIYEVCPVGEPSGQACYRYLDPLRTRVRVHVQLIEDV